MTDIPPTPPGVKTAYTDPDHMRLHEALVGPRHAGIVGEPVDPMTGELRPWRELEHLSGPDPDDPWAVA